MFRMGDQANGNAPFCNGMHQEPLLAFFGQVCGNAPYNELAKLLLT